MKTSAAGHGGYRSWWGLKKSAGRGGHFCCCVQNGCELLARLERGRLPRGDQDGFSGPRIPCLARLLLLHSEIAEPAKIHPVPGSECLGDFVKGRFENRGNLRLRALGGIGDCFDELLLRHSASAYQAIRRTRRRCSKNHVIFVCRAQLDSLFNSIPQSRSASRSRVPWWDRRSESR